MIPQQTDRQVFSSETGRSYFLFHFGTVGHTVSAAVVDGDVAT